MLRIVVAATLVIASSWAMPSMAADATQEKCTCDLKPESVLNNGASVRNATACWSTEDVDRQWCDISVQAIEGDGRHQMIINEFVHLQSDPVKMTEFLQAQAQNSLGSLSDPSTMEFVAKAQIELPAVMKASAEESTECVAAFQRYRETKEPFKGIYDEQFTCQIGATTGWLRMTYVIGDIRFVYMVAPDA